MLRKRNKFLSWFMAVAMVFTMLLSMMPAKAFAAGYDSNAALQYAREHYDSDAKNDCTNFVSACLRAGGCTDVNKSVVSDLMEFLKNNYGELKQVNVRKNYVYVSDNEGILSPGDPIFFVCPYHDAREGHTFRTSDNLHGIHAALCGEAKDGKYTMYAHSNPKGGEITGDLIGIKNGYYECACGYNGEVELWTVHMNADTAIANSIVVTVYAKDKDTSEKVPVSGAIVTLFVGKDARYIAAPTDKDGKTAISMTELKPSELKNATISAYKTIGYGKAIEGTARDPLFSQFPKDPEGEYYRCEYQLHSEYIDKNGNWCGMHIPKTYKTGSEVDIAFAIDGTGSMADEINNVKENIAAFSKDLIDQGLDIRFSIIEYRDITCEEETKIHVLHGSHWYSDMDSIKNILGGIDATGGGDTPESAVDALGKVASDDMYWRSYAHKFAFLMTDADYKNENNFGYADMGGVIEALSKKGIVTSVITSSDYKEVYSDLYSRTGGIYADIYSSNFREELMALSNSIIEHTIGEMELTLSEPRELVNLSLCYLANDKTSRSDEYRDSMKRMLKEYGQYIAKTTDGHILVDKMILFSTDDMMNFYDTSNIASMADIHVETRENDSDKVRIHSNAHIDGFYCDDKYCSDDTGHFKNLENPDKLKGKSTFYRIQMSGVEGAGWDNSFIDDAAQYATTVTHESGHYIFGFYDEYLDRNRDQWKSHNKPYKAYGLMDNNHEDIEMSKASIDYAYFGGTFPPATDPRHTLHSAKYGGSCEDVLAKMLIEGESQFSYVDLLDKACPYKVEYTKAVGPNDRTAGYSYAVLADEDFLPASQPTASGSMTVSSVRALGKGGDTHLENVEFVQQSLCRTAFKGGEAGIECVLTCEKEGNYALFGKKIGDSEFSEYTLTKDSEKLKADLPVARGEMAEVAVVYEKDGVSQGNIYYIDRSEMTDAGYIYTSMDNTVEAYATNDGETSYTFVADNTDYENGEYRSVNQATVIQTDDDKPITGGEIYSVASSRARLDFTTVKWFKFDGSAWTELPTDLSEDENLNIGARADLTGGGLYVLMAKPASEGEAKPAVNLSYTQSKTVDAIVTLKFDDPNENSKFYNVYYSDSDFTSTDEEGVISRNFSADSTELTLDLFERERHVYAAVEIVLEDGKRSPLSSKIELVAGTADSDEDGVPDWYCDEYLLWPKDGEEKDIAGGDEDEDGKTNLEEYDGDSGPTDPDDPIHTTVIPVKGIEVDKTELTLNIGETKEIVAVVLPDNATNKSVVWSSDNPSIVSVTPDGSKCSVIGKKGGTAIVSAVTEDGGYAANCKITVSENTPGDLDKDGEVTILDVQILFNHVNEITPIPAEDIPIGDVDKDGEITILDVQMVFNHVNEIKPLS